MGGLFNPAPLLLIVSRGLPEELLKGLRHVAYSVKSGHLGYLLKSK